MKINIKYTFLSVALLFIGLQVTQAQSKTELENDLKISNAKIDSMSLRLTSLEVMYTFAKDSIIKNEFNPSEFGMKVDSLSALSDSSLLLLTTENTVLTDSIATLYTQNEAQSKTIDDCVIWMNAVSKKPVTRADIENGLNDEHKEILKQLGQLKELLDTGVLTQEEFDAKKTMLINKW